LIPADITVKASADRTLSVMPRSGFTGNGLGGGGGAAGT